MHSGGKYPAAQRLFTRASGITPSAGARHAGAERVTEGVGYGGDRTIPSPRSTGCAGEEAASAAPLWARVPRPLSAFRMTLARSRGSPVTATVVFSRWRYT